MLVPSCGVPSRVLSPCGLFLGTCCKEVMFLHRTISSFHFPCALFRKSSAGSPGAERSCSKAYMVLEGSRLSNQKPIAWIPVPRNLCLGSSEVERAACRAEFASWASDLRGVPLFWFSFLVTLTEWLHFLCFLLLLCLEVGYVIFQSRNPARDEDIRVKESCDAGNWEESQLESGLESIKTHVVKGVMEPDSLLGG